MKELSRWNLLEYDNVFKSNSVRRGGEKNFQNRKIEILDNSKIKYSKESKIKELFENIAFEIECLDGAAWFFIFMGTLLLIGILGVVLRN
jgi:hypothetical protein